MSYRHLHIGLLLLLALCVWDPPHNWLSALRPVAICFCLAILAGAVASFIRRHRVRVYLTRDPHKDAPAVTRMGK
jgi:hypothetical protein